MEITTEENDDHTVCRFRGELDAYTVDEARAVLHGVVRAPLVLLDLCEVGFVDSAGIGCLIGAIRRAREAGGEVAVVSSRPALTRILHTTGFDRIVAVRETVGDALAAAKAGPRIT